MDIRKISLCLALMLTAGCASIPTYRQSVGMGMLRNPDPSGGLIDPPILGPASTFLSSRGYATAPIDGMGPILTMERRADSTADRISLLESRHEGDPGGWITIEVDGTSYIVRAGKYIAVKPSDQVREDADSLIARLHPPEQQ
jgi:hypothetical protein